MKRFKIKVVSIKGMAFLKIRNAFYTIMVKGFTNRVLELKLKLELLRLRIKA